MDALLKARAFVQARQDGDATINMRGGKSERSGITPDDEDLSPLLPLIQPPRVSYADGCLLALEALKVRLERGLDALATEPTVAAEVDWLRLAARSWRIIARMSRDSSGAGASLLGSPFVRWHVELQWPEVSRQALEEWCP